MKKIVSILLVVMMLVSMIPATVLAAAETFTYDFSKFSGSSTQYAAETHTLSTDVTLQMVGCHINTQLRVYGSKSGQFAIFKADSKPISAIKVNAGYKADTLIVSGSNDDGATWTQVTTFTTTTSYKDYSNTLATTYKWIKLTVKGTGQVRVAKITLTLNPADDACNHEGYTWNEGTDGVAATCTATGLTPSQICSNCGEVAQTRTTIDKLPHNLENGICVGCQGVAYELVTDLSKLHSGSQILIVAAEVATTMGTDADKNNRPEAAIDKQDNLVITNENVQILAIEEGTESGTYAFKTDAGYLYAAGGTSDNRLKTTATLDAKGSWNIEIDEAGIATIKCADAAVTRNWIRYNKSSKIFSCYAEGQENVVIYMLPVADEPDVPEVPACDHDGYECEAEDGMPATCTTPGKTNSVYCENCGDTIEESVEIPATGHNYENGVCTNCGEAEPPVVTGYVKVTNVADVLAGGQFVIVANNGGTYQALSTTLNKKINPTTVTVTDDVVTTEEPPVWEIKAISNGIALYNGSNYLTYVSSTDLGSSASPYGWTVEVASEGTFYITSANVTDRGLIYQAGTGNRFGGYKTTNRNASGYVGGLELYKLFEEEVDPNACTHELTEVTEGYPATCTTDGKEDTLSCACGQNVQEGAVIPSPGHSYDDDYCTVCKIINPEAAKQAKAIDGLPAVGDSVIFYHPNGKVAMGAAADGDRMGAVTVTKENGLIPYSATHTAVMTVEKVGDYYRFRMDGLYLTSGETGNTMCFAALPAEGETDYTLWEVTADSSYGVFIRSVNAIYTDKNGAKFDNQTIEYYQGKFYPYGFNGTDYITSYRIQIGLANYVTLAADATEEIAVTGNLYLDLNGFSATASADQIYAWDSSATTTTAGTGKLTTQDEIVTDYTNVYGDRYIALKDAEGNYTFHALELKLTAVTLRTNKAGIFYKAEMACDEVLKAAIESHGIAVSIMGMPTADFANEENTAATKIMGAPESVFTSGSITNIFRSNLAPEKNAARGEMKIYANPYIQLVGGTVLMGNNNAEKSLKDVMDYLNTNYATLKAEEQENVKEFYTTWAEDMASWNLENLAAAIVPTVPEEEEQA